MSTSTAADGAVSVAVRDSGTGWAGRPVERPGLRLVTELALPDGVAVIPEPYQITVRLAA